MRIVQMEHGVAQPFRNGSAAVTAPDKEVTESEKVNTFIEGGVMIRYLSVNCHRCVLVPWNKEFVPEQFRKRFLYFNLKADRDLALYPLVDKFRLEFEVEVADLVGENGTLYYRLMPVGHMFDDARRASYPYGIMLETIYGAVKP
jgi:hypothetical protein